MIGRIIEGFQITDKLGEGGMGEVFRAIDTTLGRVVAVKVLHSELMKDPQLTERFLSEAKTQAQLNHPNLATLFRLFQFEDSYFMVMEYIDGETVGQIVRRDGPIQQDRALHLFKQALAGLAHAHHAGIIHRDIKPSNLMVTRQGIVKVMDFGIAKILGGRGMTATGVRLGTLYYMSPEQIRNQPLDIRTDIYALGITLYEMVTGRVPFDSNSDYELMQQHIQQAPPYPRQFFPYISPGIEAAILQSLEKDPARRFQTVEAFGRALDEGVRVTTSTVRPTVATPIEGTGQTIFTPVPRSTPPPTPPPTGGTFSGLQPTQVVTPPPGTGGVQPRTPAPFISAPYRATTPPPAMTPPPGSAYVPPQTPIPATSTGYPSQQMGWTPTATEPTGYPQVPPGQEVPAAPRKSNWALILGALAVVVVVLLAVGVIVARRFLRQGNKEQATQVQASETPAPVNPTTPAPGVAQNPSTPSPTEQAAPPPETKTASKTTAKDSKKLKTAAAPAPDKQSAEAKAALQALIQQQIEQEKQRQLQQQIQEQQKNKPAPAVPAPAPPKPAAPVFAFRVEHDHGDNFKQNCAGTLNISADHVSFKADSGPHSFDAPIASVKEIKKNRAFWSVASFHVRLASGENYNFARIGPDAKIISPNDVVAKADELMAAKKHP